MMSASNSDLKSNLVSSPIAYAQPAQPYVPNAPYDSSTRYPAQYTPPTGKWRDDWWHCFSNLWPSCCCVASGGQFGGILSFFCFRLLVSFRMHGNVSGCSDFNPSWLAPHQNNHDSLRHPDCAICAYQSYYCCSKRRHWYRIYTALYSHHGRICLPHHPSL
jgi:hypothetical protein